MVKKLNWKKSSKLFKEEFKYIPAGTSSNARLWRVSCPVYEPCSVFIEKAKGSHIWDVDGNEYIDYRLGYGPVILGHAYKKVVDAVNKAAKKGSIYALDTELELDVAKKMVKMIPCFDMVRFANSGTEATMNAIRLSRAYTKKDKIIKFEGHYHGAHDYVLFSTSPPKNSKKVPIKASLGIPKSVENLVIVEGWNDFHSIEKTVKKNHKDVAAIITEPVMGNASAIMPKKDYLKHLKELCDKYDILLIFDEVKTGFRLGKGGAQERFRVTPHLSTFAKAMGNGYPVAAFGGDRDIMSMIGPDKVIHGGTYSANPLSMTAANITMKELSNDKVFEHIEDYGRKMMKGVSSLFNDHKIPNVVSGCSAMFQFLFTKRKEINNYMDLYDCDSDLYARFHFELLKRGVMIDEDNDEVIFSSYSHSKKDLKKTLDAFEDSIHNALIGKSALT